MIKVANAPCSWGVLEFDLEGEAAGYAQVLDEIAATGYAGTELGDWGFMPTDPKQLRQEIHSRGLTLLGAFVPVMLKDRNAHVPGIETAVRTARLMAEAEGDTPFIVLADDNGKVPSRTQNAGRVTPEMGLSDSEWKVFAEGAEKVAEAVKKETGLRTVFHHHCAGYVERPIEVDVLMKSTDPSLLGLCFDTGHYRFGGGDPLSGLHTYKDRIWHVHFKDCHPQIAAQSRAEKWDYFTSVRNGIFCELGKGEIDFPRIAAELEKIGYNGWVVVEQDVLPGMGKPRESAQRNRDYLASIGLKPSAVQI
ncbi:MAG: xylose isomerase [Anaerolineae bacterium]|nr:MAG: xylose isomerase [Anaerolineae bacterium]WKZ43226.1 MAG: TIM barrel protein [Anaerolineales bacterium]